MKRKIDKTHPPSLMDFIIAAIEESAPAVDGHAVYQRGCERYYAWHHEQERRRAGLPPRLRRPKDEDWTI
jgi:hypothetical protein